MRDFAISFAKSTLRCGKFSTPSLDVYSQQALLCLYLVLHHTLYMFTTCICHTDCTATRRVTRTRTPLHTYTNLPTGTAPQLHSDPSVLTTATTTTSSASEPQMYYNFGESIVEQVLRVCTSTSTDSTSQPAAAKPSAMPTVASAAKQEPVAATVAPVSSAVASAAPLAATQARVVFTQLQQPRKYNGSTSWKDYRAHFERLCNVNGWITAQDKAQNLTLFLEGPAADVLKDLELAPTAYEDIWKQLGYNDAPRDARRRFDSRRQ